MQTLAKVDVMFTPDALPTAAKFYLNGQSATLPLISPVYADLHGLPPLQIHASRHEVLLSDATRLHARAQAAGVRSELLLRDRLPHVWPTMVMLPEARETLRQCGAYIASMTPLQGVHATAAA
jgi:acetyl esterase/lipase